MWTLFILLGLGALHSTVSSSPPSPIDVFFSSVNLRNVLQWFPGNGTPGDTHFTVQYAIYGDSIEGSKGRRVHWRAVQHCTDVVRSWCDLTDETWDHEEGYHARVRAVSRRASSKWAMTRRFDPKLDTSFGPPLVSVEIENNSAIITVKGPMRYQPNNHTPVVSMATFYPQMMYNLSIHNKGHGRMSHFLLVDSPYKHRLMDYSTEYCFSAKTKFLSMPVLCQSSAWHCITTPPDPIIGQLQRVIVGIVVPSVCICLLAVVGYLLYHYLSGNRQKNPNALRIPSFKPSTLTLHPEYNNITLVTVMKPPDFESSISKPACRKQHTADPPGYMPQRSETPPELEELWDNVSVDYGFVAAAPQIDVRGGQEGRESRHDRGDDGNNLKGGRQKFVGSGFYNKKEWRVEDGVYAPQAKSHLSQESTHTCSQTQMLLHRRTERRRFIQAHAFSQVTSVPPSQTQTQGGIGQENDGNVRIKADGQINGGVEEGSESESLSFLYAAQNIKDMSTSSTDQSDFLPDDYGVSWWTWDEKDDDDDEDDEEEEVGASCIDWDPVTRKLVLPGMEIEFNSEGGSDGFLQGEKGNENRMGGEQEDVNAMKGELTLKNVYVRQASEEEAETEQEMEGGRKRGWATEYVLSKWDLVLSMDE